MSAHEPFDQRTWKTRVAERLQDWRSHMRQYGLPSVYAFLSASALWPVAEAAQRGEWTALTALGGVTASVGTNLLANTIQQWRDEELRRELAQLQSTVRYEVHLEGEGAIAQGPGAVSGGKGAVIITGGAAGG
jgi:hypothetical protein